MSKTAEAPIQIRHLEGCPAETDPELARVKVEQYNQPRPNGGPIATVRRCMQCGAHEVD